jgi:mutator protein MutT
MIDVVAAIITNDEGKILITQRNLKKLQGGLWEFPGGKIEKDETREEAIIREIKEELTIDIKVDEYLDEKIFNYPEKDINLIALKCSKINGDIKLTEHEDAKWVANKELDKFDFAPADMFIVEKLKGDKNAKI